MKIVAGLGSIDEYETFVKAGADEFFCGYVPFSWAEKYGVIHPLNRREVLLQCADWFHERTADSEKNGGLLWQAGKIDV